MFSSRQEIETKVIDFLAEMLELEPGGITADTNLYEDLDLDSIDAIDLMLRIQEITGHKVASENFKQIRIVNDVVDAIEVLLKS